MPSPELSFVLLLSPPPQAARANVAQSNINLNKRFKVQSLQFSDNPVNVIIIVARAAMATSIGAVGGFPTPKSRKAGAYVSC